MNGTALPVSTALKEATMDPRGRVLGIGRRFAAMLLALPLLGIGSVGVPEPARAQTITWTAISDGSWNNPVNWTPNQVPDVAGEAAIIPAGSGTYTITVNISPTIDWLRAENASATLRFTSSLLTLLNAEGWTNDGTVYTQNTVGIRGTVWNRSAGQIRVMTNGLLYIGTPAWTNDGRIVLNDGGTNDARIRLDANLEIAGTGEILLNGDSESDEIYSDIAATLTQRAGHLIHGRGRIRVPLVNQGTVTADATRLWINSGTSVTNQGLLRATNGATLEIRGIPVQNAGGRIFADGGTVEVQSAASVTGGTLESAGGWTVRGVGSTKLQDVTLAPGAQYTVAQSSTTALAGTIANEGVILVNEAGSLDSRIRLDTNVELTGSGRVLLNGDSEYDEFYTDNGSVLTQRAGHLIHGHGRIRVPFINQGTVTADATRLWINGGTSVTNQSLLRATNGATLEMRGITVQNAGGRIFADGGTVEVRDAASVTGGTLESVAGSTIRGLALVKLQDVTFAPGTQYNVAQSSTTALEGTITNGGEILLNEVGSLDSRIRLDTNVELTGSGQVLMNGDSDSDEFYADNASVLTLRAGQLIHGHGRIRVSFVNQGTVTADDTRLWINSISSATNQSLLRATNGATLEIRGIPVQNAGGRIFADGGTVEIRDGALVTGGTLESAVGSTIRDFGLAKLQDVTLAPGTQYNVAQSGTTALAGTITNGGEILLNEAGSLDSRIRLDTHVELTGSGQIRLNGDSDSDEFYSDNASVLTQRMAHLIHGSGRIRVAFINEGTVRADRPAFPLKIDTSSFTNLGAVEATLGAEVYALQLPTNYAAGTLTGGIWHPQTNSTLRLVGVDVAKNRAEIILDGPSSRILSSTAGKDALAAFATNEYGGIFRIRNGRNYTPAVAFRNEGQVILESGGTLTDPTPYVQAAELTLVQQGGTLIADSVRVTGGWLCGTGVVQGRVLVTGGRVAPGASIGRLTIQGNYEQSPAGTLDIEVAGTTDGQVDLLRVTGTASLGGKLSVHSVGGFLGQVGQTYKVLSCGHRVGQFDADPRQFVAPGIWVEATYTDTTVVLVTHAVAPAAVTGGNPVAEDRVFVSASCTRAPVLNVELSRSAEIAVEVFDLRGRLVGRLPSSQSAPGLRSYSLVRDICAGGQLSSGVYFTRTVLAEVGVEKVFRSRFVLVR
jgi:hypothetical protein